MSDLAGNPAVRLRRRPDDLELRAAFAFERLVATIAFDHQAAALTVDHGFTSRLLKIVDAARAALIMALQLSPRPRSRQTQPPE
jgi:hypothetical protein